MDNQENLLEPLQRLCYTVTHLLERSLQEEWEVFQADLVVYQKDAEQQLNSSYMASIMASNQVNDALVLLENIQRVHSLLEKNAEDRQQKIASELRQMLTAGKALDAYGQ